MSRLDPSKLARLGAVGLAVAAVLAAALAVSRQAPSGQRGPAAPSSTSLSAELDRCRALSAAAQDDLLCRAAWRESRDQFFGEHSETRR